MKERRVAVLGLARSGTALSLALRDRGVAVCAGDRKPISEIPSAAHLAERGVELYPGGPDMAMLDGAELLAVSPGVARDSPLTEEARRRVIPVLPEFEVAWRILEEESTGRNRYAAVTGSNGKSTVASWLADALRRSGRPVALAGNIGTALSGFCADNSPRDFVVELSSFQLETIAKFRPDVAVVTNITPDHLDRHGSLEAYAAAKARIFENQSGEDASVVNEDDPVSRALSPRRRIGFSRQRAVPGGVSVEGGAIVSRAGGAERAVLPLADLGLPGIHNLENALAVVAVADALGVEPGPLAESLREFAGLPHRCRTIARIGGVAWVDDSKGTNPDAVVKSLAGFPAGTVLLVLGGSDKGSDFRPLAPEVSRAARVVFTIGQSAQKIEAALPGADVRRAGDLARAVAMAAGQARPGETVLLSPACASFDQYANFEERGRHFAELVGKVAEGSRGA
jgi:UDP-N-acetylmuramoylalanine--D-glutamate ligase